MAIELVYLILSTWVEEMSGDTVPDNNKKFPFRKLIPKIQIEKKNGQIMLKTFHGTISYFIIHLKVKKKEMRVE